MCYQYDVVIIGGGSGGLAAALDAGQLGLRVLLIEKVRLGGGLLWYGSVPSKALVAAAKRINDVRTTDRVGLPKLWMKPDFIASMARMQRVQDRMLPRISQEYLLEQGCIVEFGEPQFTGKHELLLSGRIISFHYAIIATGSRPIIPLMPGLEEAGCLTSGDVFTLKRQPERLAIIGGGPMSVELGQIFQRFGTKVTIVVREGILPREDASMAKQVATLLEAEGIRIVVGIANAVRTEGGIKTIIVHDNKGQEVQIACDDILIAIGRRPNTEGLALERAGVKYDDRRIIVDSLLRTKTRNIFAIGDVVGGLQFGHMAESHARTVIHNIITPFFKEHAKQVVPWVTFCDPELAHVGITEEQAIVRHIPYEVLSHEFETNDRALCEERTSGKIKVIITPAGKLLGASVLGPNAGELIQEYAFAMQHGMSIQDIAATVHAYPTFSAGSWKVAGAHYKHNILTRNKVLARFFTRL